MKFRRSYEALVACAKVTTIASYSLTFTEELTDNETKEKLK